MKTTWDYSDLANAYLMRPDYSDSAIDDMLKIAGIQKGAKVCDVGAGVAHLTLKLAVRGLDVTAVEPNDAMRANGIKRTADFPKVRWFEGTGEQSGQPANTYEMVTFGSSFNVTDRTAALKESIRILKPNGWFACMWNHRDLKDPIQSKIESIIKSVISDYDYGTRRADQTDFLNESGMLRELHKVEGRVLHTQSVEDCLEAWRSHATLHRQAGPKFKLIIEKISEALDQTKLSKIQIPYTTNIWVAQVK
ncbi:MAG: methyltransferase domain-containing protein [Oligoflexia bacterium]|nr:methyltransferase domain-containing protein [Oligoflexia bacterium]